jgi:hypothetical protein
MCKYVNRTKHVRYVIVSTLRSTQDKEPVPLRGYRQSIFVCIAFEV